MRKIFTSIFLLLICLSFTQAQISSRMMVDKDSLAIGEEFEIEFRITASSNHRIKGIGIIDFDSIQSQVKTSDIPDSLLLETYAELEWPADFNPTNRIIPIKEFEQQGNDLVKKIPLRFWDIGLYILPQLEIIQDSTYSLSVQHFQTPFIQVLPPLNITPADTTQALMPIKHILKEPKTWEDFVWIAYALAGLFTLLLIGYMIYRSKHEVIEFEEKEEVIIRPAHVVSLEKLNQLDSKKLWQKGEIKAYQSELTYIIREYLENRFGIHALESTISIVDLWIKQ